jgi:hypothetical protein
MRLLIVHKAGGTEEKYVYEPCIRSVITVTAPLLPDDGQSSWLLTQRSKGSIAGVTRFSEYQRVWNGVHPALVRVNKELLERKVAAPVYTNEINDRRGSAALTKRHPSIHKSWH